MPEKPYSRITYTERLIIEKRYNAGFSMRSIAESLGHAASSICYEIHRGLYDALDGSTWNTVRRCSATIAQEDADFR